MALLCTSSFGGTARGIDRYTASLSNELKSLPDVEVQIRELQHGLPCPMAAYLRSELAAPLKMIRTKADVYHAVAPFLSKAAILVGKKPLVTSFLDLIPFKNAETHFHVNTSNNSYVYSRLMFHLATHSRLIVVPFEVTKRDLMTVLNVPEDKIRVVPLGVDTAVFQPVPATIRQESENGRKVVLSVMGDVCEQKGLGFLLRSFARASREVDAELWVGGRWIDRPLFDGLLKELNLEGRVRHLGYIADEALPRYYGSADVCVVPSRQGFSLPILESMACGTPVIAPDTADIKEVVEDTSLLVDPTDIDAMAGAMTKVLTDGQLHAGLRQTALIRSRQFTWKRAAHETLKVYEESRQ